MGTFLISSPVTNVGGSYFENSCSNIMQPYPRASLSVTPSLSSLSITPTQNKGTASPTVRIPQIISPQVRSIVVGPFHSQVQFYPVVAKTEIIKAQTL